jgi:hypothetical protein
MKQLPLLAGLLVLSAWLTGCNRSLDVEEVRAFIDKADDAARKRFAPEICELRGERFKLQVHYQSRDNVPPAEMEIDRKLFCREAGRFSRLRQYRLERRSLEIDIAEDATTADVVAEYIETRPFYGDGVIPATPDDFVEFVVVESRDASVVGIEGGDLVYLSSSIEAEETEMIKKSVLKLPYD